MARPRTPILSVSGIRAAALAVIDREGLAALSMRRLAQELDVQAASLYSHYRTKEDLLADIANEIMAEVDVSGFATGDWRHGLTVWARSYRAALAAHPNLVPVIAHGPGRREAALRRADAVHGGLVSAGWPARHATMIGASTKYLVVGAAINSFARGFDADVQVYRDRYPNLSQAHRLAEHAAEIDRDSFELALSAFLDGLSRIYEGLGADTGR
ncbi:TetR/AcrR family transcriptional regulator [Streptomonospora nanhaiensis]|uniref:AcrR family transcriptional regulator n=1 Tax=Streptomonospora nanhaiensis TaxID=1323731 RepID=A0A853BWX5_9ACTN|nr:TetR/AcrR family transcriptional regulator [Streptomonospora nanhaiensis]MBV2364693.1 TetR/AcrR family transcriptional regulator [Streptomonospora nanhaiensis]MBX9388327.1 TetR/AcrR family transcriptional regulator [Streptomonospora nanhaiensis]NYI99255.1 AcrR family transcriptional regulator [Streptomonospora nanhaiensis]